MKRRICSLIVLALAHGGCSSLDHTTQGRSYQTVLRQDIRPTGTRLHLRPTGGDASGRIDFEVRYQPRCVVQEHFTQTAEKIDHYRPGVGSVMIVGAGGGVAGVGLATFGFASDDYKVGFSGVGLAVVSLAAAAIMAEGGVG